MPLRSTPSSHDTVAYMMIGERREHQHRDPDQRDVVGLAGVEDLRPRPCCEAMNSPTIAPVSASPMLTRSTEMIHGRQDGTTSLRNTCQRDGAERIEQLLAVRIERLDAGVGGQRRDHERQRGGDRDLGDEPEAEHQDDERRERELGDRLEADDVGLHDRRVVARPPERQTEQRARGGADQEAEDGRAEREADVGPGVAAR